ncbi:hypothetical protein [Macrococcoides canis]|uniref:hypothetical protein n=1 Tax=Macrococcoides canis TaxID=1855823 RepID=UPI00165E6372|nr:hypothetical protein [Macrococcus canis]QNR07801.1 hypothetical protein GL258_05860 [Macrococcus canis]
MKTIKRERQVRLDELLKHIFDNQIKGEVFENGGSDVQVDIHGSVMFDEWISKNDRFKITEEVEITEDTKIPLIVAMNRDIVNRYAGWSIQDLLDRDKKFGMDYENIYILNDDGSIGDLIWTKERGLVD